MEDAMIHAVQSYVRTKKGRIGLSSARECVSADSARRTAERLVNTGQAVGAMAFSKVLDAVTGEFEELRVIGSFGTVCDPGDEILF